MNNNNNNKNDYEEEEVVVEVLGDKNNSNNNNNIVGVDDDDVDDDDDDDDDHIILWPKPLRVAPVDPSRSKCDVTRHERHKLTEEIISLLSEEEDEEEGSTTTTTTTKKKVNEESSSSSSSSQEQQQKSSSSTTTNKNNTPPQARKGRRIVIITGETVHYRSAARSIPTTTTTTNTNTGNGHNNNNFKFNGLEIGCAYGDCLSILSKVCGKNGGTAIGVDKSTECITELNARYPKLQNNAIVLDCFKEPTKLNEIICENSINVCCLDIGGDRHGEAVLNLICDNILLHQQQTTIQILIVKARIIYNDGVKVEPNQLKQWWKQLCSSRGNQLSIPKWADINNKQKKQGGGKNNNKNKKIKNGDHTKLEK